MRIFATKTTFEPPYKSTKWGAECIELGSSGEKEVPNPYSYLSEVGVQKIAAGKTIRFFSSDIGFRSLTEDFFTAV